jgi:Mannosyl-glycoprotein endo-beta-N-acetylglucosaminidase/Putative peptidoglycan binding domain
MQKAAFFAIAVGPAQASHKATGVPASVTLAQAIIESGWGDSHMGDAWNFFGIKAQGDDPFVVVRTREVVGGKDVFINAKFRRYASMEECFRAHGEFLRDNPRYAPAFRTKDAESFARAIHAAGYATDPHYSDALIGIMRENNLTQYDTGAGFKPLDVDPKAPKVYRLQQPQLQGPVVMAIQQALAKAGCNPGTVDGVFGKMTDTAVRRYQTAHGLAVDGAVGPATAGRLGVTLGPPRREGVV